VKGEIGMADVITAITETIVPLVGTVFTVITGNALLVAFLAASLLGVGISVFRRLRNVAR
jgi:hypothetical protein